MARSEQFVDLLVDGSLSVGDETPLSLADRMVLWINVELVGDHLRRYTSHVRCRSGKDVRVSP